MLNQFLSFSSIGQNQGNTIIRLLFSKDKCIFPKISQCYIREMMLIELTLIAMLSHIYMFMDKTAIKGIQHSRLLIALAIFKGYLNGMCIPTVDLGSEIYFCNFRMIFFFKP